MQLEAEFEGSKFRKQMQNSPKVKTKFVFVGETMWMHFLLMILYFVNADHLRLYGTASLISSQITQLNPPNEFTAGGAFHPQILPLNPSITGFSAHFRFNFVFRLNV